MHIFISYSKRDEMFALQLDASLLAAGQKTFFAQRDVLVGDSIPKRVFDSIASADAVAVILSNDSVKSRWVADELSAAKMQQMKDVRVKILPVLIDGVSLPESIAHLRYSDFRDWRHSRNYEIAFAELLRGLGLSATPFRENDAAWYEANSGTIISFRSLLLVSAGMIEGAVYMMHNNQFGLSSVLKTVYDALVNPLHDFVSLTRFSDGGRIQSLASACSSLSSEAFRLAGNSRDGAHELYLELQVIARMIDDLQTSYEFAARQS